MLFSYPAAAVCPPDAKLSVVNRVNETVTTTVSDQAISEGSLSISMPLDLASGELVLNPTNLSLGGVQTISVAREAWRLKLKSKSLPLPPAIVATYLVTGSNGLPGVLSSPAKPSSVIPVTVVTRSIDQPNKNQYSGYIDLVLDYSTAQISGPHTGTLTITVDCF